MNLLLDYQKDFIKFLKILGKDNLIIYPNDLKNLIVGNPPENIDADLSFNAAMSLAKFNKENPLDLAKKLKKLFEKKFNEFETIEIAKPGFINFKFKVDFWNNYIFKIIKLKNNFGSNKNKKMRYNIEFVSANPTGPLHVGHCRGAILGDVLANLLKFNGHMVNKEYYVNDFGGQIKNFVDSVYYRILEIQGTKKFPNDENLYPGDYIIDIAKRILNKKNIKNFNNLDNVYKKLAQESLKISMETIKENLKLLGVKHDTFVYESKLVKSNSVSKIVRELEKKKYVYIGKLEPPKGDVNINWKSRDQLLFNSTKFGDDIDRPLQKEDKTWTYFASDIAYHSNKVKRNFDVLINILGADHAGYIKRLKAAVTAISNDENKLICKVSQLVKLFKEGKPFKMSKRKGEYITIEDLIKEVGKDSARFMMLNRSNEVELDFDFEKVVEKSKDNPVFYVQYAYARINSIFRALNLSLENDIKIDKKSFSLNSHEIKILKKISEWPNCIEISSKKLEPHRIPFYLYDLSTLFHSYWNLGKENKELRFVSSSNSNNKSKLIILKALATVIENGMKILGVAIPKIM